MLFRPLHCFYGKFISLKTTLIFLGILIFFYLLGTIFPQGKEYASDGGILLAIIKYLDLLNLFSSPLFLLLSLLFFLHLGLCTWERLQHLWSKRPTASLELEKGQLVCQSKTIMLSSGPATSMDAMNNIFKQLGFRSVKESQEGETAVIEKGLSHHWLSLIYHLVLFICLIGFFITYLFAFEGEITLHLQQRQKVPEPSSKPRWITILEGVRLNPGPVQGLELELENFSTEYIQLAKLNYPKDFLGRIALALGFSARKPLYSADSSLSYFPKDWKSHLTLYDEGKPVKEKAIEVNDPLQYQGLTFYQMAFQQELKLVIEANQTIRGKETIISVNSGEKFRLPPLPGYFKTSTLRLGTLYKKDGTKEDIVPSAKLYYLDPKPEKEPVELGSLTLNQPLPYQGISLTLRDYSEASILSFRYDPGRPWLWLASVSLLLFMTLRIWGGWYRVIYWLEREADGCYLRYVYKGIGLGADETRLLTRLKHYLTQKE